MKFTLKKSLIILLVLMFSGAFVFSARAAYPTKKITMYVPYSAGGSSDLGVRRLSQRIEKVLGQPIIVENVIGAGGWVAWNKLARAKPDGYTLSMLALPYVAGYLNLATKRNMDLNSITPLANHVIDFTAWAVLPSFPYKDIKELLEYVKIHPGEVKVATSGVNTQHHILLIELAKLGYKMEPVHTNGLSDALTMALGGHVDIVSLGAGDVRKQVKDGNLRALAVMSDRRSPFLPDVPTLAEATGLNLQAFAARGYAAPANLDKEASEVLNAAFAKVMAEPEHVKEMDLMGLEVRYMNSDDYMKFLKSVEKQYKDALGW
ncbi:MAG: Bug family tripartite tricarboxylate transporter substrate binding protein [Pyramidobacter sp.]